MVSITHEGGLNIGIISSDTILVICSYAFIDRFILDYNVYG
ncbi:hypothetical protein EDD68_12019 [Melghiribacillus thermohalophilus]|uniref:Uncharacterized protein n=1 Tax=Melghiribacillus thermohalophilus TaxID=1324956 RepID=A0A4R3MTW9_9BACI|nr:hypothetical protein EDD68_12019 [Melghiribacillus thermohalophilus]